jgi:DNA-binding transcriptional ArsR family regulator
VNHRSLLALFRNPTTLEILLELFVPEAAELTVGEIAQRIGAPQPTVSRELARLELGGIVRSRRAAQAKFVSPDPDLPFAAALRRLLIEAHGALPAIAAELVTVEHVDAVFVAGAYAAYFGGSPRPDSGELVLLVVGDPDLAELDAAASRIEERIELRPRIEVCLRGEWEQWERTERGVGHFGHLLPVPL